MKWAFFVLKELMHGMYYSLLEWVYVCSIQWANDADMCTSFHLNISHMHTGTQTHTHTYIFNINVFIWIKYYIYRCLQRTWALDNIFNILVYYVCVFFSILLCLFWCRMCIMWQCLHAVGINIRDSNYRLFSTLSLELKWCWMFHESS